MCRSKDQSGRRCKCDTSEKRRLRRRNQKAIQSIALPAKPRPNAPVDAPKIAPSIKVDDQPTYDTCREQMNAVNVAKDQWKETVQSEELGKYSIPALKAMRRVEEETRRLGSMVCALVDKETGMTDMEYSQQWDNQLQSLKDERESTTLESERERLSVQISRMSSVDGVPVKEYLMQRGEQTLEVMKKLRDIGNSELFNADSDSSDLKSGYSQVSSFFPDDWVEKANGERVKLETNDETGVDGQYLAGRAIQVNAMYLAGSQMPDDGDESTVYLRDYSRQVLRSTFLHETTHHMEYVTRTNGVPLSEVERSFLKRRTTHAGRREEPVKGDILRGMTVYADSFSSAYTGRDYSKGDMYEVLTTGAESVFMGKNGGLMGLLNSRPDPDHKHFVIGTWLSH